MLPPRVSFATIVSGESESQPQPAVAGACGNRTHRAPLGAQTVLKVSRLPRASVVTRVCARNRSALARLPGPLIRAVRGWWRVCGGTKGAQRTCLCADERLVERKSRRPLCLGVALHPPLGFSNHLVHVAQR